MRHKAGIDKISFRDARLIGCDGLSTLARYVKRGPGTAGTRRLGGMTAPRARDVKRGESAIGGAQEAVKDTAGIYDGSRDGARVGPIVLGIVPWAGPVPAPGASKLVSVPSGSRT